MNQNCFNNFTFNLRDFLIKFWEISKKCSNFVNFRAKKMFFFFKQVRISPEKDWFSHQWPYDDQMWYMATLLMNNHFDLCPHAGPLCSVIFLALLLCQMFWFPCEWEVCLMRHVMCRWLWDCVSVGWLCGPVRWLCGPVRWLLGYVSILSSGHTAVDSVEIKPI